MAAIPAAEKEDPCSAVSFPRTGWIARRRSAADYAVLLLATRYGLRPCDRTSPYKDRIDLIGQRLVEQRYHPEVTAQHLREWLRVTHYLQEQGLKRRCIHDGGNGAGRPSPSTPRRWGDMWRTGLSASAPVERASYGPPFGSSSTPSSPRRDLVLRTLLVLLYLTGLRAGEALRLTLADVELETAVLHIRDTKFGKSRLVPLAADVAARLEHCRDTLTDELGERTPGEPFFPAPSGQPYSLSALRGAFHAVLAAAAIPRWQGGRSLRLHDLRHSFAVLRLTLWYRQQAPLGSLLAALATYLGHVGIASSQRYLQLTEDVVADLTHRYATCFGHLLSDGGPR